MELLVFREHYRKKNKPFPTSFTLDQPLEPFSWFSVEKKKKYRKFMGGNGRTKKEVHLTP